MLSIYTDAHFMKQALLLAQQAFDQGEVPIGAVVVSNHQIIGKGYNQVENLQDPTAHAEILAITAAADYLGTKYLTECTLFVTIEPCVMCAGAIKWAQFKRIVFGAPEPKSGFSRLSPPILHKKTQITRGILQEECANLMKIFFKSRRR